MMIIKREFQCNFCSYCIRLFCLSSSSSNTTTIEYTHVVYSRSLIYSGRGASTMDTIIGAVSFIFLMRLFTMYLSSMLRMGSTPGLGIVSDLCTDQFFNGRRATNRIESNRIIGAVSFIFLMRLFTMYLSSMLRMGSTPGLGIVSDLCTDQFFNGRRATNRIESNRIFDWKFGWSSLDASVLASPCCNYFRLVRDLI